LRIWQSANGGELGASTRWMRSARILEGPIGVEVAGTNLGDMCFFGIWKHKSRILREAWRANKPQPKRRTARSCAVPIHSSRRRFAARLNSGVRPHGWNRSASISSEASHDSGRDRRSRCCLTCIKKKRGDLLCSFSVSRLRFDPALFRGSDAGAAAARANLTLGQRRMATGALFNLRRNSASCRRR
jgi:hypothetical protein